MIRNRDPGKEYVYYDVYSNEIFVHWSFFLEQIYEYSFVLLGVL